jgi:hypothetical protein
MELARNVRQLRLREWRVYRSMHARRDAMLGQRRPDMLVRRHLGQSFGVLQFGVRERRLHGRLHARLDAVIG